MILHTIVKNVSIHPTEHFLQNYVALGLDVDSSLRARRRIKHHALRSACFLDQSHIHLLPHLLGFLEEVATEVVEAGAIQGAVDGHADFHVELFAVLPVFDCLQEVL